MPNWVDNRIIAIGDSDALAEFIVLHLCDLKSGQVRFDFETVIPMPPIVRLTDASSDGQLGLVALGVNVPGQWPSSPRTVKEALRQPWAREARIRSRAGLLAHLREHRPKTLEAAERLIACHRQTGCRDWYDWSVEHWGTKWNAHSTKLAGKREGRLTVDFLTA